jgi:hypothetical protein
MISDLASGARPIRLRQPFLGPAQLVPQRLARAVASLEILPPEGYAIRGVVLGEMHLFDPRDQLVEPQLEIMQSKVGSVFHRAALRPST